MSNKTFYLLLVVTVLLFDALQAKSEYSNPVLYLLDETEHSYLIRGKFPEAEGRFAYEELREHIKSYLEENGRQISNGFQLIVVSLLNPFNAAEWRMEKAWFCKNPEKSCLLNYPLYGCFINPCQLSTSLRGIYLSFDPDGLKTLTYWLKCLLEGGYGGECVIYFHCRVGKDRTGEAASCYLMQYKGYSYSESLKLSRQIAKRNLRTLSINAIRWYAYYLRDIHRYPTIGAIN